MTLSKKRKYLIASLGSLFLIAIILFTIFYFGRINIYEPLSIKIKSDRGYIVSGIIINATQPLGGNVPLYPDTLKNCWSISTGYFKELRINFIPSEREKITGSITIEIYSIPDNSLIASFPGTNTSPPTIVLSEIQKRNNFSLIKKVFLTNFNNLGSIMILLMFLVLLLYVRKSEFLLTINKIVTILFILWGLGMLILASFYSFPHMEDIEIAADYKNGGVFNSAIELLLIYDGRYFTNFLHGLNPLVWGYVQGFKLIPILSLLLITGSLCFFIITIFEKNISKTLAIICSETIVIIHFATIPSIVHDLYWIASSFVYLYAWIFFFLWTSLLIRLLRTKNYTIKLLYFVSAVFCLIGSYGINEMMLILNAFSLIIIALFLFKYKSSLFLEIIPFLLIAILCTLLFISSPGIVYRYNSFGIEKTPQYLSEIFIVGLKQFCFTTYGWLFKNTFTIPMMVVSIFLLNTIRDKLFVFFSKKMIFLLLFSLVSLMFILTYTFYFPMGADEFPERIYNFIHWIFLFIVLFILPLLFIKIGIIQKLNLEKYQPYAVSIVLFFTLVMSFFSSNNLTLISREFMDGSYKKYYIEMQKRYEVMNNARNDVGWKCAIIDTLAAKPKSIFLPADLFLYRKKGLNKRDFPGYFLEDGLHRYNFRKKNKDYSGYFMLDEVKLRGDSVSVIQLIKKYAYVNVVPEIMEIQFVKRYDKR